MAEINSFKEESIHRIEKYANDNLTKKDKESFDSRNSFGVLIDGRGNNWKDYIRFLGKKERILENEKEEKKLIDEFKRISDRSREDRQKYTSNTEHNDDYSWNSQPPPKGKYDDKKINQIIKTTVINNQNQLRNRLKVPKTI